MAVVRRKGCLLRLLMLALLAGIALLWTADEIYRWRSNFVFWSYRDSDQPLEVSTKKGWKLLSDLSLAELDSSLDEKGNNEGFRVGELRLRREATTLTQKLASALRDSRVTIFLISPEQYRFQTSFKDKFALTTARERRASEDAALAITANFRDPQGKPLGWVYSKGQIVNRAFPNWTGAFFVKNGTPYFGPKSLVDEVAGDIQEGTQGYPSVMKNHTVFSYVDLAPDKYFDGKRITYRALAGTRRDGSVIFVLSGEGGVMNVSEITSLAMKLQLQHATLLDGGRALQYSYQLPGSGLRHFRAFNTQIDSGPVWTRAQRSPVYIVVKPKAPKS